MEAVQPLLNTTIPSSENRCGSPRADLEDVIDLAHMTAGLGWTGASTALFLKARYGMNAHDKLDLMELTDYQAQDLKEILTYAGSSKELQ